MNTEAEAAPAPREVLAVARRRGHRLGSVVRAAVFAAALVTVLSWLARSSWLLELITHFRVQMCLGAVALGLAALAAGYRGTAGLAAAVAFANLLPAAPYVIAHGAGPDTGRAPVRIMTANVQFGNRDYEALLELVEEQDPEILGLVEVDPAWIAGVAALEATYPYRILRPLPGAFGLALYSRVPLLEQAASPYRPEGVQTAILAEIGVDGRDVTLVLAHVMAPTSAAKAAFRNRQLQEIAAMLEAGGGTERMLMGDLNITPWSPYYAQLETRAGLANAARYRGWRPTWPAGAGLFGIPIDHVLLSDGLAVHRFLTGPGIGSDHLPVIVDISDPTIPTG